MIRRMAIAVALAGCLAAAGDAMAAAQGGAVPANPAQAAGDSILDARTREISAVLRCPVCQGESIQDSPAELAQQMRAVVREQLQAGRTPDEIKAYFVARYGEWILLEPAPTGLNIALYVFPVVLVLGGLVLVFVVVRRWTAASADAQPRPVDE